MGNIEKSLLKIKAVFLRPDEPFTWASGIKDAYDVLEFLYAGASAVAIGTMNLVNPYICKEIIEDLPRVLAEYGFKDINDCIGYAHRKEK